MSMNDPTESGLVIPVAALEDFVARWRPQVDDAAPIGLPAHITVLYPFVPPTAVEHEIDGLRRLFSGWPSFSYSLNEVGWFGTEVVFARPEPGAPFAALTDAVHRRWGTPPYAGTIDDPRPHVTLGLGGTPEMMRAVADAAARILPLHERATGVWLVQGTSDPPVWQVTHRFELGG